MTRPGTLLALILLAFVVSASGQDAAPAAETLSLQEINDRIASLRETTTLDEATRAGAVALYEQAAAELQQAEQLVVRTAELTEKAGEAPGLLATIREELSRPVTEPVVTLPESPTLEKVQKWVAETEAELAEARRRVDELRAEADTRSSRRAALGDELAAARAQVAELEPQVQAVQTPADEMARARAAHLRARLRTARQRVTMLEEEGRSYDARAELLPARRDRAARRVTDGQKLVTARQEAARQFSETEMRRLRDEARRLAAEVAAGYPGLAELSAEIESLGAERRTAQEKFNRVSDDLTAIRELRNDVSGRARAARRRVEAAGLTQAVGILLRRELRSLPDARERRHRLEAIDDDLADVQLRLVVLDQKRDEQGDVEQQLPQILAQLDNPPPEAEAVARDLLTRRRDLLDDLAADWTRAFNRMAELDTALRGLIDEIASYRRYIEERILWVRSVTGGVGVGLERLGEAMRWLFDPGGWRAAGRFAVAGMRDRWPLTLAVVALLVVLVAARATLKRRLGQLADASGGIHGDSIGLTFLALLVVLLLALPGPLLLVAIGRLLAASPDPSGLGEAVGAGIMRTAASLLPLEFFRQLLRRSGPAIAHFRWSPRACASVRRELGGLMVTVLPAVFVWATMEAQTIEEGWSDALGRLAFVVAMLAVTVFAFRAMRRSAPLYREGVVPGHGWVARTWSVWFFATVGLPIVLVGLALAGYYYTAIRLEESLAETFRLALALLVVHALMVRWLLIAKRRLLIEERRRIREQAASAGAESGEIPAPPPEEESIDVPAIDAKTRNLFRYTVTGVALAGIFVLWSDVLPALGMLQRVQLWPTLAIVELPTADDATAAATSAPPPAAEATPPGASATPSPASGGLPLPSTNGGGSTAASSPESESSRITLGHVLAAIMFGVITVIAIRTVPALLEIVVVTRLPLDAGARYALLTVIKYVIMIGGVVATFGALGIGWAKVQWIAAALTFGLAFGLQEIFANFISGLILLAERPIRVGDTVTVQNISGTVSRIRMRATTITDWDRKEMVIPNKSFITEQIVNWTLTDPVLRLTIPVGVSYESEVEKVEKLLYKVARRHKKVLVDPPPRVVFSAFGESTLDFQLRVFIPCIDDFVIMRHELHIAIIREFRKEGIEIAFPQRDLHLRSVLPLEIVPAAEREDAAGGATPPA